MQLQPHACGDAYAGDVALTEISDPTTGCQVYQKEIPLLQNRPFPSFVAIPFHPQNDLWIGRVCVQKQNRVGSTEFYLMEVFPRMDISHSDLCIDCWVGHPLDNGDSKKEGPE